MRLPARRLDRHVRRPLRAAGGSRSRPAAGRDRRAAALSSRAGPSRPSPRRARRALVVGALRRLRRVAARRRSPSSNPGCSTRPTSTATSRTLYAAYRAELDRLGLWDRDLLRRRACERLLGDLDAWHGEPVFAYGFEDLTAAEWSLLEALAGRADVDVSLPYEPGRAAFASLRRTAEDLAALAAGRVEELPPRSSEYAAPALAQLERTLFEPGAEPQPIGGAVRFLEGAGATGNARARRRGGARRFCAAGRHPSRSRSSCRRSSAGVRRSRPCSRALGIPYAIDARVRLAATPLGHALRVAAPLRVGRRRSTRALRVPSLAVLGHRALERRLRRGPAARPCRRRARAGRGGDRAAARGAARRAARPAGRRVAGRGRPHGARARWSAPPTGSTRRRRETSRGSTSAASPPRRALLDELAGFEALGEPLGTDELIAALERLEVAGRRRERGPRRVLDLLRARTRRFETSSCSASRRARCRGAAAARRSSTTTGGASSAAGSSGPTRSAATATSSTRPARARRAASTSCARRRPTTARRARRARSGTTWPPSSTPTTSSGRRGGARSPS